MDLSELLKLDRIWYLILAALTTEAATNLLVKSEISNKFIKKPLFKWRKKKICGFLHELLDCGYCTSVWVAIIPALWYLDLAEWFTPFVIILVIHRLSNALHYMIDILWDLKRPRDF